MVKKTKQNKYYLNSRKKTRKVFYGGQQSFESINQSQERQTQEQQQPHQEEPTLLSNINSVVDLGASAANVAIASGIENLAERIGVDTNKSANQIVNQVSEKVGDIVDALNSPEGQELKKDVSELAEEAVEILQPSIEKAEDIALNGVKKLTKTGSSIAMTALNEIPPIFALTELSKAVTAGVQAGETIAELTTTGTEAIKNLEQQKEKANSILEQGRNLLSSFLEKGNKYVANTIQGAQDYVDTYGNNIMKNKNKIQYGGLKEVNNTFQKLNKEAMMVGGRIHKSQMEFLGTQVKKTRRNKYTNKNNKRKTNKLY